MSNLTQSGAEPTTAPVKDEITAEQRCDRCGAAGYVIAYLRISENLPQGGRLIFCAHHYRSHKDALAPYVSRLRDERHRLAQG